MCELIGNRDPIEVMMRAKAHVIERLAAVHAEVRLEALEGDFPAFFALCDASDELDIAIRFAQQSKQLGEGTCHQL